MNRRFLLLLILLALLPQTRADTEQYRRWIADMREQPRGPFSRIRWFCNDGSVLPPKAYACRPHGGGVQHGQWSERTLELRSAGYLVANLLAGIDPEAALSDADFENQYAQRLIEKYLMSVDNGWIFHRALFYRGAIQEEDERAGARRLLNTMLSRPEWVGTHYLATRTGAALLPHGADSGSISRVRQQSAALSEDDPTFMPLRIKIHGAPSRTDAAAVRKHMDTVADPELRVRYAALAEELDRIYRTGPMGPWLGGLAAQQGLPAALAERLRTAAAAWEDGDAMARMALSGELLAALREALPETPAGRRLDLLDASLRIESAHFRAATEVRESFDTLSRSQMLRALSAAGDAAYGTGLLNRRLYRSQRDALAALLAGDVGVADYRQTLNYVGLAPGWAVQAMRRYFYRSMRKLGEIEPQAMLFIQDQLRGSPMLFYSQALNLLARDAGRLAGIRHRVFGQDVGSGFTALNPGLARGQLHTRNVLEQLESLRGDGIYLLPETISDLPPVAGILTEGAGNPLSHVQLLARNLGIPNVSVGPDIQRILREHDGTRVVLAVSPGGLVEIAEDGPQWDRIFVEQAQEQPMIRPDLDKLDLSLDRPVSMAELSAADSGRTVGPKAAKLAELRKHYPDAVARGVALPFGVFWSEVLNRPHRSGTTLFRWMQSEYRRLAGLPEGDQRRRQTEALREEIYDSVRYTRLSDEFLDRLDAALRREFGGPPTGLFVRSDTNVEDLAGFTGAGLNLTLPNVVGREQLREAIPRVWASPFTARAFSWRQAHMTAPEHVYTSILLLESVGSDKSGVLVTADIDTGARDTISVAVNEGLGGAVDGQAAESLRIPLDGGEPRVLATATAPFRRVLDPAGGIEKVPSSGADAVLTPAEIDRLREFARSLPRRFPPITDDAGRPAPADVEFGFVDGRLQLFQLRPFLDSVNARANGYLQQMDRSGAGRVNQPLNLEEQPFANLAY